MSPLKFVPKLPLLPLIKLKYYPRYTLKFQTYAIMKIYNCHSLSLYMFLNYPAQLLLIYKNLFELNMHVMSSYEASTNACMSNKDIFLSFSNHGKCFLNDLAAFTVTLLCRLLLIFELNLYIIPLTNL